MTNMSCSHSCSFLHLARVYTCKMQDHLASPFFSPSIDLQERGMLRLAAFWAFSGCFLHALQVFLARCFSSGSEGSYCSVCVASPKSLVFVCLFNRTMLYTNMNLNVLTIHRECVLTFVFHVAQGSNCLFDSCAGPTTPARRVPPAYEQKAIFKTDSAFRVHEIFEPQKEGSHHFGCPCMVCGETLRHGFYHRLKHTGSLFPLSSKPIGLQP